ncbi:LuxR C-terminal-related transcriptional regulator [Kutzneria kofuensis]|uniref:DNA-binding NarL/FixJ family response regulator n=1 Tax=Kutzneria kofuensis TaxID=103725 RepID=A0A7W9KNI4_9PSEU|nr:response regulator transcription factor [Kutzneria kofuensis]MBB5895084.1 DNA-binding NarL/FixJ family response regulator [Kutzneria kofuensis]
MSNVAAAGAVLTLPARPAVIEAVTVVVASGEPVVRLGLRVLCGDFDVVAEAATARDAVREVLLHRPDVLVLDLVDGETVLAELRRSARDVAVLALASTDDDDSLRAALRSGVRGYLHKDANRDEIVRAIQGVAAGEMIFGPAAADRLLGLVGRPLGVAATPFPGLTGREREVLNLVAAGLSNQLIARQLRLSPKTVSNHLSAIFAKLRTASRAEAIVLAREAGLGMGMV